MQVSQRGLAEIISHEAIVLSPYKDSVGVWTVFIGHTKAAGSPDPLSLPKGVEQPLDVALTVFRRDLAKFERRVNSAVRVPLKQYEFDALVSFDFNTGRIHNATLTKKLNAGDHAGAIAEFDKWHRPPEVKGRRDKEKALFARGVYSGDGKASIYPADAQGRVQWSKGRRVDVFALLRDGPERPAGPPQPPPPDLAPVEPRPPPPAPPSPAGPTAAVGVGAVAAFVALADQGFRWIGIAVVIAALGYLTFRFRTQLWSGVKAVGRGVRAIINRFRK